MRKMSPKYRNSWWNNQYIMAILWWHPKFHKCCFQGSLRLIKWSQAKKKFHEIQKKKAISWNNNVTTKKTPSRSNFMTTKRSSSQDRATATSKLWWLYSDSEKFVCDFEIVKSRVRPASDRSHFLLQTPRYLEDLKNDWPVCIHTEEALTGRK